LYFAECESVETTVEVIMKTVEGALAPTKVGSIGAFAWNPGTSFSAECHL
jgi:hypothetical protein